MFTQIDADFITLEEDVWLSQQRKHEERVDTLIGDYLKKRSSHQKNPVIDFLFEYYHFRPSQLKKWSPGIEVGLKFSDEGQLPFFDEWKVNDHTAYLDPKRLPEKRISSMQWMLTLLKNTDEKKPSFGCFGMHEWAMVYKSDNPRHNQVPLRMNAQDLADFVESRPLLCTHFDAYRFFTKPAIPLNKHVLSREIFHEMEQPGCIHSNMDLYKWAFKMYPWISSDLILQAFELAVEARYIDMKASPYDLSDQGLDPIKIETEEGRVIYKREQEKIWEKGIILRERLIQSYTKILNYVKENRDV